MSKQNTALPGGAGGGGSTPIIQQILGRLGDYQRSGDGWVACCPAHDDRRASLSIREGLDGTVLLHCFAGCTPEAVVNALGLKMSDLFPRDGNARSQPARRIVAVYDYLDGAGKLLFQTVRFEPKDFRQRRPDPAASDGWRWDLHGIQPVLYRLPQVVEAVRAGETVFIVEGEKDADALAALGLCATTCPMGAGKWRDSYSEALAGANVVILPDNDDPGRRHARQVAESLHRHGCTVRVLELPELPPKGDVSDWLSSGGTRDELLRLAEVCPPWEPPTEQQTPPLPHPPDKERESQATRLVKLGQRAELWHTPEGEVYATIQVGDHRENLPLRSRVFRDWLSKCFYEQEGKTPGGQALEEALNTLRGDALFGGPEYPIHVRLAPAGDRLYLDLADEAWRVVEISPDGWRVTQDPPVRFRRARGMLPLPEPEPGGSLTILRQYVNTPGEDEWLLLVAWLVGSLHPQGPYPALVLQGEQGSAKSFTARVLRALVDPNIAALRTIPREERDLMIAARNAWIVCYDNLSGLAPWLSDAICRLSTGGGFGTRELYQDTDEILIDAKRPVVINGIDDLAERDDLRDRAIIVTLPPIPEDRRREESELWLVFKADRPRILGALLDAVSAALRGAGSVHLDRLPRMADFARWVAAAETALPWKTGTFLEAYTANRQAAAEAGITDNPVAQAVIAVAQAGEWRGTATELLERLSREADERIQKTKTWPASPKALGNRLRRLAPTLRTVGVEVGFEREAHTGRRVVSLRTVVQHNVTLVTNVTEGQKALGHKDLQGDVSGDIMRPATHETSPQTSPLPPSGDIMPASGDIIPGKTSPAEALSANGSDNGDDGDVSLPPCSKWEEDVV